MKMIFDALEDRFGTNKRLRIIGRKLVRPTEINPKNEVRPFVTVDGSMVEKMDTFTSDLEKWALEFVYNGKSLRVADADEWLEQMIATFEHAKIASGQFTTVSMTMTGQDGPSRDGEVFTASVSFDLMIQRAKLSPRVRYA